ncbi:MAG: tyrosine-protein phosphatase [Clostridia bacterium]|nr:tyrosine-protein phosphatase [Clostridia bacterium]
MKNLRVISFILAMLLTATLCLFGCGKGSDDTGKQSGSQSGTGSSSPIVVEPPVYETAQDNIPPEGYTRKSFLSCGDGAHSYINEPTYYFDVEQTKAYLVFDCQNCYDNRLIAADLQISEDLTPPTCSSITYNMSNTVLATASAVVDGKAYTKTAHVTKFHTDEQAKVYTTAASNIWKTANGKTEKSLPLDTVFSWIVHEGEFNFTFTLSTDSQFKNIVEQISTDQLSVSVTNLLAGQTYYWQVEQSSNGGIFTGGVYEFTTSCGAPRNLNIPGVTNARDLGGRFTSSGNRVKQGLIYRTARFDALTQDNQTAKDGLEVVKKLGFKTQIDLRGNPDDDNIHYPFGNEIDYLYLPMTTKEGNIIEAEENMDSLKAVFETFAYENAYPIVFHCSIGTDRTGAVAFLLNALLGVDFIQLKQDYIFSLYGEIGGSRNGDAIDDYRDILVQNAPDASTLQEQAYLYLQDVVGVHPYHLDKIIENMLY